MRETHKNKVFLCTAVGALRVSVFPESTFTLSRGDLNQIMPARPLRYSDKIVVNKTERKKSRFVKLLTNDNMMMMTMTK